MVGQKGGFCRDTLAGATVLASRNLSFRDKSRLEKIECGVGYEACSKSE